jgi:hypothetical protein
LSKKSKFFVKIELNELIIITYFWLLFPFSEKAEIKEIKKPRNQEIKEKATRQNVLSKILKDKG